MKIAFSEIAVPRAGALVVGVLEDRVLTRTGAALDKRTGGALARAMKSSRFTGAKGQFLEVLQPAGLRLGRVVLAGLGKAADIDDLYV